VKRAGGALARPGSHGIGFSYWVFSAAKDSERYSHLGTYVHGDKTKLDDEQSHHRVEGNAIAVIENSGLGRGAWMIASRFTARAD